MFCTRARTRARAHVRALMTQNSCAIGMRNAKLGNHLKRETRLLASGLPQGGVRGGRGICAGARGFRMSGRSFRCWQISLIGDIVEVFSLVVVISVLLDALRWTKT